MSDRVREQFEAWYSSDRSALSESDCWLAWQASRAAALEDAARAMHPEIRSMLSRGEAAAAIRALIAPPKGGAR